MDLLTTPLPLFFRLLLGVFLSGAIGLAAYMRDSLTESGVLGAVLVGTLIFGFGGLSWGLLLITFFVTSTLLSRVHKQRKEELAADKFAKGSRRDFWQALANAGIPAVLAVVYAFHSTNAVMAAFVAALATANADTWATELGVLSRRKPVLITTFKPVDRGTSGGVSVAGTLATLAGALVIGGAMALFFAASQTVQARAAGFDARFWLIVAALSTWMLPAAAAGGLAGSLFDSLLGATAQAIYWSPWREKETEKRTDPNGKPNTYLRGLRWLNNDAVNVLAIGVGALFGALAWEGYVLFLRPLISRFFA